MKRELFFVVVSCALLAACSTGLRAGYRYDFTDAGRSSPYATIETGLPLIETNRAVFDDAAVGLHSSVTFSSRKPARRLFRRPDHHGAIGPMLFAWGRKFAFITTITFQFGDELALQPSLCGLWLFNDQSAVAPQGQACVRGSTQGWAGVDAGVASVFLGFR